MADCLELDRRPVGEAVYRREYRKADGRFLWLYGRSPHRLEPTCETADEIAQGGELRYHPLRDEWHVYAAHRQDRTFKPSAAEDPLAPTVSGRPQTEIPFSDFELAIFENKFAAFHASASNCTALAGIATEPASGACEVVVYGPEAQGSLHTIGQDRRRVLLAALVDRYAALFAQGCQYVLPFENRGDEVGVTLSHPHGQIYGFDRVPAVQRRAIAAFANGYDLSEEIAAAMPDYGLGEEGGIAAFVPRFARFPYEAWLSPRHRRAGLWECDDAEIEGLAFWLGELTRRYDALFEQPAATMIAFHSAPAGGSAGYHFTVQAYPLLRAPGRLKYLASVEQHTGVFTVDVMPEAAARALRDL